MHVKLVLEDNFQRSHTFLMTGSGYKKLSVCKLSVTVNVLLQYTDHSFLLIIAAELNLW